jgi:hypothetical protein
MKTNIYFFIISCSFRLRMRNVSNKSCRENQNTFLFKNFYSKIVPFRKKCRKILLNGAGHVTVRLMRIGCWALKATNTHTHRM